MNESNPNITKCETNGTMMSVYFYVGKRIDIPAATKFGESIPLVDPVDNDNWSKVPHEVIDSRLTAYAKLAYISLRRYNYFGTGFTFVNIMPSEDNESCLMNAMSVNSKNTVKKALDELEYFGLIEVVTYRYKGVKKNLYVFKGKDQWRLPDEDTARKYHSQFKKIPKKPKVTPDIPKEPEVIYEEPIVDSDEFIDDFEEEIFVD